MTTPTNPQEPFSPFLPATFVVPELQDRLNIYISEKLGQFSDVINDKKIGAFTQSTEAVNGEKWSYDTTSKVRNGYQYVIRVPSFPSSGSVTYPAPPDINPQFVISHVWGSASKPCSAVGAGDGVYFSFMNQGDSRVSFTFTDLLITITVTTNLSAYSGFVVIEYIRDGV